MFKFFSIKKLIAFVFFLIFCLGLFYSYKNKNELKNLSIYKSLPKEIKSVTRVFLSNKMSTYKLNNDYNVRFLPETVNFNLEFNKVKINILDDNKKNIYGVTPFYIDLVDNNLLLTFKYSEIFYIKVPELLSSGQEDNKPVFKKINHNLKKIKILDTLVHENFIYLSAQLEIDPGCKRFVIYKSNFSLDELFFEKIFTDQVCFETIIMAGKMQFHEGYRGLIVSTGGDISDNKYKNPSDPRPQDDNSLSGKILLIDHKNGNHKIFSKGHRNVIGLYVNKEGLILATENGPRGGDEINLIEEGKNYGWPISSYGSHEDYLPKKPFYKKSHIDYNFQEPIFSFIPSIGISEIIKLGDNFSEFWKDSFLISSLNDRHIYRTVFDKKYKKIKFYERIFIGERIRDIKFYDKENLIFLALEETGSIGILKNPTYTGTRY